MSRDTRICNFGLNISENTDEDWDTYEQCIWKGGGYARFEGPGFECCYGGWEGYQFPTFRGTVRHSPSRTTEVAWITCCRHGIGVLFLQCTSLHFPQGTVILFILINKHFERVYIGQSRLGGRGGGLCVIISKNHGTSFWSLQILWYLSPCHHKSQTISGGRSDALPIWIMEIQTVGRITKHLT